MPDMRESPGGPHPGRSFRRTFVFQTKMRVSIGRRLEEPEHFGHLVNHTKSGIARCFLTAIAISMEEKIGSIFKCLSQ